MSEWLCTLRPEGRIPPCCSRLGARCCGGLPDAVTKTASGLLLLLLLKGVSKSLLEVTPLWARLHHPQPF